MSDAMSKYERQTLGELIHWKGRPFYWREASVEKLVKRGFAEPHPDYPRGFVITALGRAAYEALP